MIGPEESKMVAAAVIRMDKQQKIRTICYIANMLGVEDEVSLKQPEHEVR